jgi:hypothetical protein
VWPYLRVLSTWLPAASLVPDRIRLDDVFRWLVGARRASDSERQCWACSGFSGTHGGADRWHAWRPAPSHRVELARGSSEEVDHEGLAAGRQPGLRVGHGPHPPASCLTRVQAAAAIDLAGFEWVEALAVTLQAPLDPRMQGGDVLGQVTGTHAHGGQPAGDKAVLAVVPTCSSQANYRRPAEVDQITPLLGRLTVELEGNPVNGVLRCWRVCECSDGAQGPGP